MARALADVEPIVKTGEVDITPDDISVTVEQFYEQAAQEQQARIDIALDAHLGQIFLTRRRKESQARGRYRRAGTRQSWSKRSPTGRASGGRSSAD